MPYIGAMPKGPQGQKRPADVNSAAVLVARIATGEEAETPELNRSKSSAGKAGGKARAEKLSEAQRKAIAEKASASRHRK